MTVLVTGGAGFIGSNFIIDWLNMYDETIINVDKLTYAGNHNNLGYLADNPQHVFVKGDIADSALIERVLAQYQPQAIINFAAESHVDRSIYEPAAFIQTNIVGTFRLLDCAREYWQSLTTTKQRAFRFLQVSTDEVYGSLHANAPAFSEAHCYKPNSPYSASKASSDHFVRAYHQTYGLPVLITNCSNNYGPYQFPEKLIPLTIHNALAHRSIPIYGNGLQIRDWLYVGDHCSAIRSVLEGGNCGEVYNIGGLNEKTNIEIAYTLCDMLDVLCPATEGSNIKSYRDLITYVKDRPGHDYRYAINASKIKAELNWRPAETFETGIQKTVQWYLDNQDWTQRVTSGEYYHWVERQYP